MEAQDKSGKHKQQGICPLKVSPNEMLNPETKMILPSGECWQIPPEPIVYS